MLTLEQFHNASEVLKEVILPTPLVLSECFSKQSGNHVFLKPENMQLTGAYKIRGALYKISRLSAEERLRGVVTASAGNHAQGVGFAAKKYGIKATVVMPTTAPIVKINNTKSYGAKVILEGDIYDDAYAYAKWLAESTGATFIHPFNDFDIVLGQGTVALEILEQLPNVDAILIPVGGGGLAAGVATIVKTLNPEIKVIGVEPTGAASVNLSLENNKVSSLEKVDTMADGVAVRTPGDLIFPYLQQYLDGIITVDDEELIEVFLDVMENHKMIVEYAGLLSLAALKHLDMKDKNIACVLSGGNMDVITVSSVVQRGLRRRGRVFTFSVMLPDRPGEVHRITGVIARLRGNVIKLEHNQFASINRHADLELKVTLESFGHEHKQEIIDKLISEGYTVQLYG